MVYLQRLAQRRLFTRIATSVSYFPALGQARVGVPDRCSGNQHDLDAFASPISMLQLYFLLALAKANQSRHGRVVLDRSISC